MLAGHLTPGHYVIRLTLSIYAKSMNLTLTIISSPNPQLAQGEVFELGAGGSIGRGASNSCVLPDDEKVISGSHATVELQGAGFVLVDHSTNGTFLNGSLSPTGRDLRTDINDGDQLTIGSYILSVAIIIESAAPPQANPTPTSSFLDDFSPAAAAPLAAPTPPPPAPMATAATEIDDLDKWLAPQTHQATPQAPPAFAPLADANHSGNAFSDLEHRELDPLKALDAAIGEPSIGNSFLDEDDDDDWWQQPQQDSGPAINHAADVPQPIAQQPVVQQPVVQQPEVQQPITQPPIAQQSVAPPATFVAESPPAAQSFFAESPASQQSLAAQPIAAPPVHSGATPVPAALASLAASELGLQGLSEQQVAQLVPELVAITQQAAGRLMTSLKARATIKSELGMQRTVIKPVENNPLKFSADVDGAINYLFTEQGGSFMGPTQAIDDSFNDLEDHQMAILIGMKSAYNAMLASFSPKAISNKLNINSGSGPLRKIKSAQLWEAYERNYVELVSDAEYTYNKLFGETFAITYEEQVRKLKAARASNK